MMPGVISGMLPAGRRVRSAHRLEMGALRQGWLHVLDIGCD